MRVSFNNFLGYDLRINFLMYHDKRSSKWERIQFDIHETKRSTELYEFLILAPSRNTGMERNSEI